MIGNRQRSGHHQRQFSSDNFLIDPSASSKLAQNTSHQVEYSRMMRSMQKGMGGDFLMDPPSPAVTMTRQKRNGGDVSPSELSPGLLDLHSFDTELLPEMLAPSLYDGAGGKGFDASELNFGGNKPMGKAHVVLENNLAKSFPSEKDKLNSATKIKVVVRKRPLNKKEVSKKEEDIISIEHSNSLTVHETKLKVDLTEYVEKHEFVFDAVLDEDVSNDTVYHQTVEQIVPAIFQKVKATCFAYGQTGSGKTYTMQPLPLKASQDILRLMHHAYRNQGFQLFVSFFEIYGGKLYDLLNDRSKLCMREDGKQQVCIVGLQEYRVSNVDSIKELIDRGNATRSTGTTGANEESSRSHAILQLVVKRYVDGSDTTKPARIVGKLSFIDLAGSERGADTTDNDKQTRIEGAEINKSLLALKECIRALDNSQVHIPFRGSKLTEVLRDSFIGNSRTVMISCISPNAGSCEHTLNTLRYADRVKSLSKGNGLKRDMSATNINLRESTSISLSSNLHTVSTTENNKKYENTANGSDRFGWTKHVEKEIYPPFNYDLASSGRDVNVASTRTNSYREQSREDVSIASSRSNFYREQSTNSVNIEEDDFDDEYEHGQRFLRNRNGEPYLFSSFDGKGRRAEAQSKSKDVNNDAYSFRSEEDFNALLMLEEDLVIAHRKQVEDTIDIVREEMELLDEADQPGNQLDDYISRLNNILSQKAAGIVNLQSRLAHFQRRLTEHNVLSSNMGP